jgi:hypothetical protein
MRLPLLHHILPASGRQPVQDVLAWRTTTGVVLWPSKNFSSDLSRSPVQFFTFPMPWIAGQSECQKQVFSTPDTSFMTGYTQGGKTYTPSSWIETKSDCKEKAEVFTFVTEKFTITTANLVFFGVIKAIFNFVTGVVCDTLGRKWAVIVGWYVLFFHSPRARWLFTWLSISCQIKHYI